MLFDSYASVGHWPLLILLMLATGLFAGVLAGLLGVGGGIVVVPVLFQVFTILDVEPSARMHLSVGTSLAIIIPTSLRSVLAHRAKGSVDMDLLKRWAVPMLIGVLIGTALAARVSADILTSVFAVVALAVAVHMGVGKESWRLSNHLPTGFLGKLMPAIIGTVSALMGIGGGTLGVPILSLCNYPVHRAVGTAAGFGLIIGIPGAIGMGLSGVGAPGLPPWPWTMGYVSVLGFVLIVPATVMSAPWGAALAHRLSRPVLRRCFAVFLLITSARMFWDLFQLSGA